MKHILLLVLNLCAFLFTAATTAHAAEQAPIAYPPRLDCRATMNIIGSYDLDPMSLDLGINGGVTVIQAKDNDLFELDYSDGDQILKYEFKREEVDALNRGRLTEILGTSRSGYWYNDGDHTNSLQVVSCRL